MENRLKKIILLLTLLSAVLFGEVTNTYITQKILDSKLPIVDVRTVGEWKETGLLKDAIPIEFFNTQGKYDINKFLKTLNAKVDTKKPFAIICHSGSRTSMIAPWLSKELNYKVVNLQGGMDYATHGMKMKTYPYKR